MSGLFISDALFGENAQYIFLKRDAQNLQIHALTCSHFSLRFGFSGRSRKSTVFPVASVMIKITPQHARTRVNAVFDAENAPSIPLPPP